MIYFFRAFDNYFNFKGRASRTEFWMFFLIVAIIGTVLALIDRFIWDYQIFSFNKGMLESIFSLFIAIPFLSLNVRRLHDTNRSGFYVFLHLIPILGSVVLILFLSQKSSVSENRYGKSPIYSL